MKKISTIEEYNLITGQEPSIIEFGTPMTCIPCKMTMENLHNYDINKKFNLTYYSCDDINVITSLGYNSIPVVVMITPHRKVELTDSSISMDYDELEDWINKNIGE